MKIAITHTRYTKIGGVEGYIRDLVRRLLDAGHEVHYFCEWWDQDADARIKFHKLSNPWKPIRFMKVRAYDRACSSQVREDEFDVVHGFSKSSRQDVYTDGSGTLEDFQAYSLGEASSPLRRILKRLSLHQREVLAIEKRRFTRGNFRKIVSMSRLAAEQIRRRHGLSESEVEVVYNGVDLERFRPESRATLGAEFRERLGIKPGELSVLLVGNDYRRKGVETAIDAVFELSRDSSLPPFRLLIVGKERHAREQELVRKARGLGIYDRIKFHGPNSRIERFFAVADVFLLPTRFDAFGQVVLEAMACGVPPVVSVQAGAAECVKDGESGFVLQDPRDPRAVAAKLHPLLASASLRASVGAKAREAAATYSWDRHFERIMAIYEDVARSKRSAPTAARA